MWTLSAQILQSFAPDHGNTILWRVFDEERSAIWQSFGGYPLRHFATCEEVSLYWQTIWLQCWYISTRSKHIINRVSLSCSYLALYWKHVSIEHHISAVFVRMRETLFSFTWSSGFEEQWDAHLKGMFPLYIMMRVARYVRKSLQEDKYRGEILSCYLKIIFSLF